MSSITKKMILLPLEIKMTKHILKYRLHKKLAGMMLFICVALFSVTSSAQTMEVGGFIGTSYYLGELNPGLPFNQPQLAYGGLVRYNLNPRWALKFNYYKGKVQGSDATGASVKDRELDFVSDINDFSLVAEFNFWEYYTGSKKNFFTPYIFGGASFFTFKSKSQSGVLLQPLGTEGQNIGFAGRSPYNQFSFALTFGIGIKYSLSKRIGLAFECGMRKTMTDYIDDISTTYYLDGENINPSIPGEILSDPTMSHSEYEQRGNDQNNDWYNYTGVTITYKFDLRSNKRCNSTSWK